MGAGVKDRVGGQFTDREDDVVQLVTPASEDPGCKSSRRRHLAGVQLEGPLLALHHRWETYPFVPPQRVFQAVWAGRVPLATGAAGGKSPRQSGLDAAMSWAVGCLG